MKVRVWSEKAKKMYYQGMLSLRMSTGEWLWEGKNFSFHSHFGTLMEWSGHQDKKGTPIFDGDIITCGKGKCTVKKIEGSFAFTDTENWLDEWNYADDSSRFEVIGNIFEPPVKKKQHGIKQRKNTKVS